MNTIQYPVLVYGTLRPTGGNYESFLEGYTVFEEVVTVEGFTMYGRTGFPYLCDGDHTVTATLVYVNSDDYDEVLQRLDWLEGFHADGDRANHYDRRLIDFTVDGVTRKAWIYVASKHVARDVRANIPVIEGGDWIQHLQEFYTV